MRRVVGILVALFMLIGFSGTVDVSAESAAEPFHVSADEYSLWDGSRLFVAEGHVTVRWRHALITADVLQYDAEAGWAVFTGNVFYADEEQELAGSSLHYDLNEGVAVFDDMEAVLHSEGIRGPMFVRGDRVRATDGEVQMERATLTTCECEGDIPAYRFVARELEIYPNDRVVARGVTFYDHKVPLLYLPYVTLSLKEKTSRFDLPQIGYSERTGWYIKLTYNYVLKSGRYGALLLDYFQKLGPGVGVRHTYVDDETGIGTLYAYGAGDGLGGADGAFSWERRWFGSGTPWDVRARYGYDFRGGPSGIAQERLETGLTVERRSPDGALTGDLEYRAEDRAAWLQPDTRLSVSGSLRQRLRPDLELRLRGETFDERRVGQRRRWLGYAGELRYTAPAYTLVARAEQQVNPDLKEPDPDRPGPLPWTHVSRLPEVTLRLRRLHGFDIDFGVVRLKEEPWGTSAWRGEAEVGLATRTWRLTPAASFHTSGSIRGRAYTTGHQQMTLQGRAGLNVQLLAPLSATLQYNYRDAWGGTPFRFDEVRASETFAPRLNWRSRALTASLSATYNLRTQQWGKLTANGTWRVTPDVVLRASGTYDVYAPSLEQVAATLDWRLDARSTVRLGAVYDFRTAEWRTVHTDTRLAVGGGWEAGVTAIYEFAKAEFSRHHMYVSHNACGCREIQLRYDHLQGEVWLEYHITAFPSSRVAVGAGDDKLMFEADALTDFLD